MLRSRVRAAHTHRINGVNVGELRKELTTAEGELSVGLEELLSEGNKQSMKAQLAARRMEPKNSG